METLKESYRHGASALPPDGILAVRTHLFGTHISKSLSPLILSFIFRTHGLPWTAQLNQTASPDDFAAVMGDSATIGSSITMPNKINFMSRFDTLDEKVRGIGAVNTCYMRLGQDGKRRLIGTNTDCVGIRESLLQVPDVCRMQHDLPALVLGAGGAARSAIYALWTWFGPSEIYIVNRLKDEVDLLVTGMEASLPGVRLRHVQTAEDASKLLSPVICVGTVPDLEPQASNERLTWRIDELFLSRMGGAGVLLDMCYMPSPLTRLVKLGQREGCRIILGSTVLVRVVTAQATLWMEREIDARVVDRTLHLVQQLVPSAVEPSSKL